LDKWNYDLEQLRDTARRIRGLGESTPYDEVEIRFTDLLTAGNTVRSEFSIEILVANRAVLYEIHLWIFKVNVAELQKAGVVGLRLVAGNLMGNGSYRRPA
jgi:hypothetical protein